MGGEEGRGFEAALRTGTSTFGSLALSVYGMGAEEDEGLGWAGLEESLCSALFRHCSRWPSYYPISMLTLSASQSSLPKVPTKLTYHANLAWCSSLTRLAAPG